MTKTANQNLKAMRQCDEDIEAVTKRADTIVNEARKISD